MSSYQEIGLGNQPNDGLGDGARTGGGKINAMFHAVFSTTFIKDNRWRVTRTTYDSGDQILINFKDDDVVEGWADPSTKSRWIKGVILDDTIDLDGDDPADLEDKDKFLKLNEVLK